MVISPAGVLHVKNVNEMQHVKANVYQMQHVKAKALWMQCVTAMRIRTTPDMAKRVQTRSVWARAIWTQCGSYRRRVSRQMSTRCSMSRQRPYGHADSEFHSHSR